VKSPDSVIYKLPDERPICAKLLLFMRWNINSPWNQRVTFLLARLKDANKPDAGTEKAPQKTT
jgi:hypothetical protein